jgi:hypothetical protein
MMNFKSLIAAIIIGFMMASTAQASLYNFSQTGFEEGATISGSFEGNDINSNGLIQQDELSSFSFSWSGNSLVSAFSQNLTDLTFLSYNPSRSVLGDVDPEILASNWFTTTGFAYVSGVGAGSQGGSVLDMTLGTESATTNLIQITPSAVPLPGAIWLFSSALLGFFGVKRRKI